MAAVTLSIRPLAKGTTGSRTASTHLLNLPQEIHDMIFGLAYYGDRARHYLSTRSWEEREEDRYFDDLDNYKKQPFPREKLRDLMLSKAFFVSAMQAFVGNQHYWSDAFSYGPGADKCAFHSVELSGVLFAWIREVRIRDYCYRSGVASLPNLRSLTIEFQGSYFDGLIATQRYVWRDELTAADFDQVENDAPPLRGLTTFRAVAN